MTTRTATRRKRRPVRRRKGSGFWGELRLGTRIGGAAGRAVVRGINRNRARRGKTPIPIVGDWFGKSSSRGSRRPAGRQAPFSGPHVKATNRPRRAPIGGTSVTSTGIGRTTGRTTPHGTRTPGGAGRPDPFTNPLTGGPILTPGSALLAAVVETVKAAAGIPDRSAPSHTTGRTTSTMSTPTGGDFTEALSTDANFLSAIADLAEDLKAKADELTELVAAAQAKGIDDDAGLSSLREASEGMTEVAQKVGDAGQDFESAYAGVRETAASGRVVTGDDGPVGFWTGEGA